MARYGKEYKDRVVARLLPPESAPVERVSAEVGVSALRCPVKLRSYAAVNRELGLDLDHRQHKGLNNRAERR